MVAATVTVIALITNGLLSLQKDSERLLQQYYNYATMRTCHIAVNTVKHK